MAASGYTPFQTYYSITASAVPTAGNLINGELAININDGKLFYKDSGGVVKVIASKASALSSVNNNGVVYVNSSGQSTTGTALTFDGTNFTNSQSTASPIGFKLNNNSASTSAGTRLTFQYNGGDTGYVGNQFDGTDFNNQYAANRFHIWLNNGSEQMRLTNTGLGIGTSSPSVKLDVKSTAGVAAQFERTDSMAVIGIKYNGSVGGYIGSPAAGTLSFYNGSGTETYRVDTAGNLGLGVTPSASSVCVNMEFGSYGATLSARNNASAPQFAISSNAVGNWYAPTYKINGKATQYTQQGFDGTHAWYIAGTGTAGNPITFTQAMTLDGNGNLLVGTTTSSTGNNNGLILGSAAMNVQHVSGTASGTSYVNFWYNGSLIGSITQSGTAAVLYNITSDQRLKQNIVDAAPASDLIDAIKVRQYDWKSDGSHQRYGFIAQELLSVAPEAVHQPADPEEMMAVDYSKLVPMLVKEIQSLRARVAQLESK